MSARGARSRKVVAKEIEKKEKKQAVKQKKVESILRPHDAFSDWRSTPSHNTTLPTRTVTISSDASRGTSRSSSTNGTNSNNKYRMQRIDSNESTNYGQFHRPFTSASRRTSVSEDSVTGKEKKKYQAKGKPTAAPRGRGGGVPVKKPVSQSPMPPMMRAESTLPLSSPNSKTWINFRIWEGGDSGMRPYGGFDYDEHMQSGNVLIYFKEEQQSEDRPVPQIRCDYDVLQNSGSTWLKNALLYGQIDENEEDWTLPGSSESSSMSPTMQSMQAMSPNFRHAPPPSMDEPYFGVPASRDFARNEYSPTAPGGPFAPRPETTPTHELWFTAPAHIRTPQGQRLHHVAVRNFLAMLHNKPIVGADLFEMLSTLQPEIQVMYDLDHDERSRMTPRERSVQTIVQYLTTHKLDDVRNSIKTALGLLAWAEQDNVRWRQGYLESFVHLAGVMSPQLEDSADFKRLSMGTRRNLDLAAKSLQLLLMEAEEKLSAFDFVEMWEDTAKTSTNPVFQSYIAFRQFLVNHYSRVYGSWPPHSSSGKNWLNRKIVRALQEDFGSLYDYLVNRDVHWDSREERPGKKWTMEHAKNASDFRPDVPELGLTDMLVTFDSRHGYKHVPHPYPLLPREVPSIKSPTSKKSFFSGLKKKGAEGKLDKKAHLQLSIVFSDASNIERLDAGFRGSALIDAFNNFELSADLKGVRPRDARLGRWVLLYGILQVLSTLSVDVQGLKWSSGVQYFLCADMKRCPEWVTAGHIEDIEASQLRSYCWQRSWSDRVVRSEPLELEGSSVGMVGGELDGVTSPISVMGLNGEIRRISEKIDNYGMSGGRAAGGRDSDTFGFGMGRLPAADGMARLRAYERRIENDKCKPEDVGGVKQRGDDSFRLTQSEYDRDPNRPVVPVRSPYRERFVQQGGYGEREGYGYGDEKGWGVN